jgi:hypothetical protein
MVNGKDEFHKSVAEEIGRTLFRVEAAIALLYSGKVIPAHEKLHGIKRRLINLHSHFVEREPDGTTKPGK